MKVFSLVLVLTLAGCGGGAIDSAAEKFAGIVDDICASGVPMYAEQIERSVQDSALISLVRAKMRDAVRERGNDIELNLARAIIIKCDEKNTKLVIYLFVIILQ